jgi:hypothetical protein
MSIHLFPLSRLRGKNDMVAEAADFRIAVSWPIRKVYTVAADQY